MSRTNLFRSLTAAAAFAAAGTAQANTIVIIQESTSTYRVTVTETECHDAATATIPGVGMVSVVDGHPSIAELTAPINPATGTPWSKAKGYANCPSEWYTMAIALAGMPNPFAPPSATAKIWKVVTVTNFTLTVQTITIHIILIPERPMCLYDPGVFGNAGVNYALIDERTGAAIWQKNINFDGTEMPFPMVNKDGTMWQRLPGPINLPEGGHFGGGFAMQDSFFDVFFQVDVPPNQTLQLPLSFGGGSRLGQNSAGPQGARYAAITNTLPPPCYANCDQSTTPPVLNVQDFACFLNKFAARDNYANCDQSTTPPVLNVQDFACFLNKFAAGCT